MEYLLRTPNSPPFRSALTAASADLHVPALCDVEVAAALRGAIRRSLLSVGRAEEALADYLELPLTRHGHQELLPRVLVLRDNFTAYDATYVALAEALSASLLTADRRLASAVRAHTNLTSLPAPETTP